MESLVKCKCLGDLKQFKKPNQERVKLLGIHPPHFNLISYELEDKEGNHSTIITLYSEKSNDHTDLYTDKSKKEIVSCTLNKSHSLLILTFRISRPVEKQMKNSNKQQQHTLYNYKKIKSNIAMFINRIWFTFVQIIKNN